MKVKADFEECKNIYETAKLNNISSVTVKKYVNTDISTLQLKPTKSHKKKRKKTIDDFSNMIYKMLQDEIDPLTIMSYVKSKGLELSDTNLYSYIRVYSIRYFKRNIPSISDFMKSRKLVYPTGIIVISRNALLRYITTINSAKDYIIRQNVGIIRNKYPIVRELESIFHYFSNCLKLKDDASLNKFLNTYETSHIQKIVSFVKGIKKDITAVKAAISTGLTSGFVEGYNNKLKYIKRMCYGRLSIKRLELRCRLAFNNFLPIYTPTSE